MTVPFVSIIVPTYDDWKRLPLCIKALVEQTYPREQFEVIIVNNNGTDQVPEDLLLPQHFKLLTEVKPGSYAARNTALRLARGEIIGFTDSDCIPDRAWIENAVAYLAQNKACSRVAGQVQVFPNSTQARVSELYDQIYAFPQKEYVGRGSGVTANLFAYKHVFDAVGFFDERLLSNGDLEWGRAAHKAGFPIHYVENVVIKHPARNFAELLKKEKRIGGGRGMAERALNTKVFNFICLLNGFRPRLAEIRHIWHTTNLNTTDKIKIVLLRHYLLNVRAFEHLRVQLGKAPNRA